MLLEKEGRLKREERGVVLRADGLQIHTQGDLEEWKGGRK